MNHLDRNKFSQMFDLLLSGESQRTICRLTGASPNSVSRIRQLVKDGTLKLNMTPEGAYDAYIHSVTMVFASPDPLHAQDLLDAGRTKKDIWEGYKKRCSEQGMNPYSYPEFCRQLSGCQRTEYRRGRSICFGWAQEHLPVILSYSCEEVPYAVFYAYLPYSGLCFLLPCEGKDVFTAMAAIRQALDSFGCNSPHWDISNLLPDKRSYRQREVFMEELERMSGYYSSDLLTEENPLSVPLPPIHTAFPSHEWEELLKEHCSSMIRRNGRMTCREFYENYEKCFCRPLPSHPYAVRHREIRKVGFDSHVSLGHALYSVPYRNTGASVELIYDEHKLDILLQGTVIATHTVIQDDRRCYSTVKAHMPEDPEVMKWNPRRFRYKASKIGPYSAKMVDRFFESYQIKQQGYRTCQTILALARGHEDAFEAASYRMFRNRKIPTYGYFRDALKGGAAV